MLKWSYRKGWREVYTSINKQTIQICIINQLVYPLIPVVLFLLIFFFFKIFLVNLDFSATFFPLSMSSDSVFFGLYRLTSKGGRKVGDGNGDDYNDQSQKHITLWQAKEVNTIIMKLNIMIQEFFLTLSIQHDGHSLIASLENNLL